MASAEDGDDDDDNDCPDNRQRPTSSIDDLRSNSKNDNQKYSIEQLYIECYFH